MERDCSIYILCPIYDEAEKRLQKAEKIHEEVKEMRIKHLLYLRHRMDLLREENKALRFKVKQLEKILNKALKINEL